MARRVHGGNARAAGRPDWVDDPRFKAYADRRLNWHLFMDELEAWSRQISTDECQAAFERCGVPSSRYRTVEEAMADAQLAHRDAFAEVRDAAGTFRALNPPFRFSTSPAAARPFVAGLGEHSDAVLQEAGYSPDEIEAFRGAGAVA